MNRNPQKTPRLMPVGYGNRNVVCAGPCNDCKGPVNIQLADPETLQYTNVSNPCENLRCPMPSYEQAKQNIACFESCESQQEKKCNFAKSSNLPPINVNLKMCRTYPKQEVVQQSRSWQESPKDCWSECVPDPIPPRCPDGNYAEKRGLMKPDVEYAPPKYPFDGRTTYNTFYHPKLQERATMFKPTRTFLKSDAKLDDKSVYKMTYPPFPTVPYEKPLWAKKAEFVPNEGVVSGVSTYKAAYQGGRGQPAQSTKGFRMMDPDRPPLDTRTTYRSNFNQFQREEYAKKSAKDNHVPTPCVPFKHISTYQGDYIRLIGAPRKSMKRDSFKFGDRSAQTTGSTTYKTEFVPFHFNKECQNNMPTKLYDQIYPRNTCEDVDCFCNFGQKIEPPVLPSPPCPSPCGEPEPCVNEDYKVKVTNEQNQFEPTQISVTSTPAQYICNSCC